MNITLGMLSFSTIQSLNPSEEEAKEFAESFLLPIS